MHVPEVNLVSSYVTLYNALHYSGYITSRKSHQAPSSNTIDYANTTVKNSTGLMNMIGP